MARPRPNTLSDLLQEALGETWEPKVGDRVKVRSAHGMAKGEGEVAEVSKEPALAIQLDGEDKVHRWYVASELEKA